MLWQGVAQPVGYGDGGFEWGFGQHQHKLFTAVARNPIYALAQRARDMLCCTAQDFIAQLVAVLVVELLEVVNVHEHHRQRAVVSLGTFDFLGQLVLQRTPVVAAGQAVGDGQVANFFQQFFELGRAFIHQIVKVVDVLVQGLLQLDHALLQQVNLIAVGLGGLGSAARAWSAGGV